MESNKGIVDLEFDLSNIRFDDIPQVLKYLTKSLMEVNRKVDKLLLAQKNTKPDEAQDDEDNNQLTEITQKLEKIELLTSNDPKNKVQLAELTKKLEYLEQRAAHKPEDGGDYWMNIQELVAYLPSHPAEQTVYGWTMRKKIPFHKVGKKVQFLQSEIDAWMKNKKDSEHRKTDEEIQAEVDEYIRKKKLEDQEKRMKKL